MIDGRAIVAAWRAWLAAPHGQKAADPQTLGSTFVHRRYLENRLQVAFLAGVNCGESLARADAMQRLELALFANEPGARPAHLATFDSPPISDPQCRSFSPT